MRNTHKALLAAMGEADCKCISRAQLPLVLASINYSALERFIFEEFGIAELPEYGRKWFAIDGKELRGSITAGNTRGMSIVQTVRHSAQREVIAQTYFNGRKSSEVKAVRGLLRQDVLSGNNVTLDALHLKPKTLEIVNERDDSYLVGLKKNQKELYEDMQHAPNYLKKEHSCKTVDEHGGRIDTREYSGYNVEDEYFDKRWANSGFSTLVVVRRERFFKTPQKRRKKGKIEYIQQEVNTEYFLSNKKMHDESSAQELFEAIRGHWNVEVNNHIRDVTLKEDKLSAKSVPLNENIALIRTLITSMLGRSGSTNFAALFDLFADSFEELILFLKRGFQT